MHPRTEDLLSIRDGLSDVRWREHIQQCGECAAHLAELERTRSALRALPAIEPSVSWSQVQARLQSSRSDTPVRTQRGKRVARTVIAAAIAASAAAIAVFITLQQTAVDSPEPQSLAAATSDSASTTADLTSLIERSRRLDTLLQAMPERPHVERVSMAATLDTMEDRIQWLDYQLSYAAGDLDAVQSQRLWQERVELMDSLVKVRYAQARTAAF